MAHHQTYAHDERILQALLRLTRGADDGSSEDLSATDPLLESEPQNEVVDANGWDALVRGRLPRA
jgi:hypothetical protein